MWKIIVTKTGIYRWSIIKDKHAAITVTPATKNNKTVKKPHVNINIQSTNQGISLEELKKLAKKYSVLSSGKSKSQLALLIYKIRSQSMSTFDLEKIVYLLPSKEKRKKKNKKNDF